MSLKKENRLGIVFFLIANAIIFWLVLTGNYSTTEILKIFKAATPFATGLSVIAPFIAIFVNGLISAHWKTTLVFWEIDYPLPGSKAFTKHMYRDSRIDIQSLKDRYGELPNTPQNENTLWYKIYLKHQSTVQVIESHRSWLLLRDLTTISMIFTATLGASVLLSNVATKVQFYYLGFLTLIYLLMRITAKHYGERLVTNVLAVESHSGSSPSGE